MADVSRLSPSASPSASASPRLSPSASASASPGSGGTLRVKPLSAEAAALYAPLVARHNSELACESGFDVVVAAAVTIEPGGCALVPLGIAAELIVGGVPRAYDLRPRSSVWKTNVRLANSVGLIDATYCGQIMAAVDNRSPTAPLELKPGDRYFQLVRCDGAPFAVCLVDVLSATERGDGGFGSTGTCAVSSGGDSRYGSA